MCVRTVRCSRRSRWHGIACPAYRNRFLGGTVPFGFTVSREWRFDARRSPTGAIREMHSTRAAGASLRTSRSGHI
jgi:hypothetical protein